MSQVINPERSRRVPDPERGGGVRVRYAPSPTGVPHIGGMRTALFNFLFAKNQKGNFLLRIEDTDQKRLVPGSLEKIKESLERLNLNWDEYYVQSERLEIYQKYLNELKDKEVVYEDEGAWRFKVEKGKKLQWDDGVHGTIQFASDVIEDFIIMKSDKFPTYHFANVIDDTEMMISHVLRGDEWLSSTPKHLMLYEAFGWHPPIFNHIPVILGADKKKLSKREGAKSALEYIDEGYLPEAIVNFLALLGWAPKDNREIFSLEELTQEFSLDRINKNSPIFNLEKLNWFNSQWIRKIDDARLAIIIHKRFPKFKIKDIEDNLPLVKDRLSTLDDFPKLTSFLINKEVTVDPNKIILPAEKLKKFAEKYKTIEQSNWTKAFIGNATTSVIQNENLIKPEALNSIGTAISGSTITPPIYDSLEKLGKSLTIQRLEDAIKKKSQ